MTISIQQNKIDYRSTLRVKWKCKQLVIVFVQSQGTKQVRIQTYSVWNYNLEPVRNPFDKW